jgi:hypothetical protein
MAHRLIFSPAERQVQVINASVTRQQISLATGLKAGVPLFE